MSKAAAMDVAETVIDAAVDVAQEAAETVDTLERIPNLALNGTTRKQQIIILAATALTAGGVGAAVSHFVTKKALRAQFETLLDYQLAEAEKHYTVLSEKPSLAELASEIGEQEEQAEADNEFTAVLANYQGRPLPEPSVVEAADGTLRTQNVFETNGVIGRWDQNVEDSKRNEDDPFVISREEYFEGDLDYTQSDLTFYEGDQVLAEMDDTAVPTHMVDKTVGESNLLMFGHGSQDPNIVYVRNPRTEIDYEITRSMGKYSQEVAGTDIEDDEELMARARRR